MPKGLPNSRNAYIEACNKPSPKAEQLWSHAAVYLAGRDSGWHMLANEIERKAYPIFNETYRKYCDRVLAGEKLEIAKSDPDVWIKASQKADGFKCYEMILCYVDDVMSIGEFPMKAIEGIKAVFKLKGDKAEVPDMCLGGSIAKTRTADETERWTISSEKHVKTAVQNVEESLAKKGLKLPSKCPTPFTSNYHPSGDV